MPPKTKRATIWSFLSVLLMVAMNGCEEEAPVPERLRSVAGMAHHTVRETLSALQSAVRRGDAQDFAVHVDLPQTVLIDGDRTIVETPEGFRRHYREIVNERVRRAVMEQSFDELFVNWRGSMLGHGEIWFGRDGRVRCINNAPTDVRWHELPLRYLEPNGREIIAPLPVREQTKILQKIRSATARTDADPLPEVGGGMSLTVYEADVNNDGLKEYVIAMGGMGSGGYSSVEGVFQLARTGLVRLPFDEVVVQSLFPGEDMSRFHLSLSEPFLIRRDGTVYMGFGHGIDRTYYRWDRTNRFRPLRSSELRVERHQ
jgi:hypothetical protein